MTEAVQLPLMPSSLASLEGLLRLEHFLSTLQTAFDALRASVDDPLPKKR
jgi:hypothetical protein